MTREELISKAEDFLNGLNTEIDVLYNTDVEEILNSMQFQSPFDQITEEIENNNGFDCEVIYYSNAIEYLRNNDPSLQESMGIASEMGYATENINSELLASLLKSQNVREEWGELEDEINEYFEELQERIEEIEEE